MSCGERWGAPTQTRRRATKILRQGLAAILLASVLTGCFAAADRALAPLPAVARTELSAKGLQLGAPLYVRIFKAESEMEVWLGRSDGGYALFRTYRICKWSGKLGPKKKEGDKQAPEGFYMVSSAQMNPKSTNYLSFNIGYPNAFDKEHGYTGSFLMVHGGCNSVGCYAITDAAIQELFTLAREAFTRGQRDFPVHAFPFRMTDHNLARHMSDPSYGFWLNLKEGYDAFEIANRPPIVAVRDRNYRFFADEQKLLTEFYIETASSAPDATRIISGWAK